MRAKYSGSFRSLNGGCSMPASNFRSSGVSSFLLFIFSSSQPKSSSLLVSSSELSHNLSSPLPPPLFSSFSSPPYFLSIGATSNPALTCCLISLLCSKVVMQYKVASISRIFFRNLNRFNSRRIIAVPCSSILPNLDGRQVNIFVISASKLSTLMSQQLWFILTLY